MASVGDEPTMPCSRLVPVSNPGYNGLWPHRSKGRIAEGVFAMPAACVLSQGGTPPAGAGRVPNKPTWRRAGPRDGKNSRPAVDRSPTR